MRLTGAPGKLGGLGIVAALFGCGAGGPSFCESGADMQLMPLESRGYVAHAGGSPSGLEQKEPYTNSREAFDVSYRNGFRVFEFDLITLGDGTVVAAHDGYEDVYGLDVPFAEATRDDVEGLRWRGKYEVLFAADLIEILEQHPDIWLILDSKWDHVAVAQRLVELAPDDRVRDRLVPHLDSAEHTEALEDVHAFPERMVAMYRWPGSDQELVGRMERYGIDNVMMWWDRRWSEETQAVLDEAGYNVWVHTPHDPERIEMFRDRGVRVYSDGYINCMDMR